MNKTWPTKKLGEVCEFTFGFAFKASDFNDEKRGLPVLKIGDIDKGFAEQFYDGSYDNRYLVKKGDILIGLSGSIKVAKWSGNTALLNQRVVKLDNFLKEIYPNFIYYNLPFILFRLEQDLAKLTVKNVLTRHLYNLEIPLPPLEIQKKIVAKIEELFSKIDKAIELRKKALQETEQIFPSALQKVFTKAKRKWGVKKLGNIAELNYGKGISKENRKEGGKYPIYGANGELGRTDKYLIEGEAIIVGRKGSAGAVNRVSGRFWPADVTYYILENDNIDIDYLFYCLQEIDLTQLATGIKPGINRNKVYKLDVSLPPILEQKKIVKYLDDLQEKVDKMKKLQQEQLKDLSELKNSILDKAFKGELIN